MLTGSAQRAEGLRRGAAVTTTARLIADGATRSQVQANIDARRWQRLGQAVVLHAGPVTRQQRWHAALINVGPRAVLAGFTAAEFIGLNGWGRPDIHVLAPYGARVRPVAELPVVVRRSGRWPPPRLAGYRCEAAASACIRAASELADRPACGLLAAAVQQRLVTPEQLRTELQLRPKVRHRALLLGAVGDIEGGAQALSEIDFVRLCRRAGLPAPEQQRVRRDSAGRRRYLDASWRRPDGRLVVVEVDGALHLEVRRWWDDQLRQNDLTLAGALVLRFPSAVLRTRPDSVLTQLRRALRP